LLDLPQFFLIKTNINGDTLWTKEYGGTAWDWGYSVLQTTDGGYIISGETDSFNDNMKYSIYLIKTNVNGDTLWTRLFEGNEEANGSSVQQTNDGGYIIVGGTRGYVGIDSIYLIKTDANGISGCNQRRPPTIVGTMYSQVSSPVFNVTTPASIIKNPHFLVSSSISTGTTLCNSAGINDIIPENSFSIFPDPTSNYIVIETSQNAEITILDIQGQLNKTLVSSGNKTNIDVSGFPSGIYIVEVKTDEGIAVKKFVKE